MAHASNPNEEKELEQLLTEQYNYLVRHISTREFIPHLISKEVLTTEDKEEIESKVTSVDRAGRLIDIVKMRGFKGMFQFMLVLEYDVPAAFFHVRKREARKPPSDWLAIRRVSPSLRKRRSLESMGHVTKLIQHLMKELDQQKTAVSDIMSKMSETKEEQEQDFKCYDSQMTEMEDRYALVSKELIEAKKAYEELQLKYDNLRNENEEMLNQRKQDRERLTSLQERYDKLHTDLDSMTTRQSRIRARDSTDVVVLQDEIVRLSSLLESSTQAQDVAKITRLETKLSEMAQRNMEFNADRVSAEEQRDKTMKDLRKAEERLKEQESVIVTLREENENHNKRTNDLNKEIADLEHKWYWAERAADRKVRGKREHLDWESFEAFMTQNLPTTPTTPDPEREYAKLQRDFKNFSAV